MILVRLWFFQASGSGGQRQIVRGYLELISVKNYGYTVIVRDTEEVCLIKVIYFSERLAKVCELDIILEII